MHAPIQVAVQAIAQIARDVAMDTKPAQLFILKKYIKGSVGKKAYYMVKETYLREAYARMHT